MEEKREKSIFRLLPLCVCQLEKFALKYLLLTEFEGRTVSYGPSFFPFAYGPSAKRAGHKFTGKTRIRNL